MASSSPIPAPAKKKKNLPFKRTVARKKSPEPFGDEPRPGKGKSGGDDDDDDDGINMFRQSNEVFPLAIEEQQRRLRKEEGRKKAASIEREGPEEQGPKRRRISDKLDSDDDDLTNSGGRRSSERNSTPRSTGKYVHSKIISPVPGFEDVKKDVKGKGKEVLRHGDSPSPKVLSSRETSHTPINIDDDDDDIGFSVTPSRRPRKRPTEAVTIIDDDDDSFSDGATPAPPERKGSISEDDDIAIEEPPDEFAEYVIQARERVARANAAKARASETADNPRMDQKAAWSPKPTDRRPETNIRVMVSSVFPGAATMVAKLKLTQPVGIVRDAWIKYQKDKAVAIPEDAQRNVFLTWKGNRIYNTITCEGLGLEVDSQGRVRWAHYRVGDAGYHNGGLVFEAWTEELYADYLGAKERERLRLMGELDDDDDLANIGRVDVEEEEGSPAIRVILKAKDCEALNTKVHMHTTVEAMVTVFREQRTIPPEKEASIFFDGEKLDEATTVEDAGIEDMDNLEVHIK